MSFLHNEIPRNEGHRFLDWQPDRISVSGWERWLTRRGVAHLIVRDDDGWTIYKHMWDEEAASFCCAAAA